MIGKYATDKDSNDFRPDIHRRPSEVKRKFPLISRVVRKGMDLQIIRSPVSFKSLYSQLNFLMTEEHYRHAQEMYMALLAMNIDLIAANNEDSF